MKNVVSQGPWKAGPTADKGLAAFRLKPRGVWLLCFVVLVWGATTLCGQEHAARAVLAAAGFRGGLIVHVGCGDGRLTAALRADDHSPVRGLDADSKNIQKARETISAAGLYGPVSVEPWRDTARLPFADNLVNLLLVDSKVPLAEAEAMRVLAPGGVAISWNRQSETVAAKRVKPRPKEMDEWTHWFHGPDGNNVSRDRLVGPPRRLQWTDMPFWARHHTLPNTVSVAVSSGGRVFYVLDESPNSIIAGVPDRFALVACDAFNGVELWRRPMGAWGRPAWGLLNYTDPDKRLSHFWFVPADARGRMVAAGDRLLLPLSYRESVSVLDGATGKTLHTFESSEGCRKALCDGKRIYLFGSFSLSKPRTALTAYDAGTFAPAWRAGWEQVSNAPDIAVCDGQAVVLHAGFLLALDAETGKERWQSEHRPLPAKIGFKRVFLVPQTALVLDGTDNLLAFSAKNGRFLWTYHMKRVAGKWESVPFEPCAIGDLVWVPDGLTAFAGLDLKTGAVQRSIDATSVLTSLHHHRCYSNRCTERFFLFGKENVEFVGVGEPLLQVHNWIRGGCQFGILPANGLLYVPPSACTCYMNIMLRGFNALAAGREKLDQNAEVPLELGPASGGIRSPTGDIRDADDWPTFRHDGARSGATGQPVPTTLEKVWQCPLGGRLTAPVVAGGRLLAASIDRHTVYCLDALSGKTLWTYAAGARIDSPPTIDGPRLLFGCRDGWLYCLRVSDGALAWRLRAAPAERQIAANGQLESSWPLHGSVLVHGGVAYVAAGRATRLDGGVRVLAVDPATGRVLHKATFDTAERTAPLKDNFDPEEQSGFLTDIMVAGKDHVWMRTMKFTPQLRAESIGFHGGTGGGGMIPSAGVTALPHLTAVSGFLDDQYFDRVYWGYEGVFGQILAVGPQMVYGARAYDSTSFTLSYKPGNGYLLFGQDPKERRPKSKPPAKPAKAKAPENVQEYARPHPLPGNKWTKRCDIRVLALALAGKTLVMAGPPDKVDREDPYATFEGRSGAKLRLASTENGDTLAELDIDSAPVWNGMAITAGRIYLSTSNGNVMCFGQGDKR